MKKVFKFALFGIIGLIAIGVIGAALGLGDETETTSGEKVPVTTETNGKENEYALTEENLEKVVVETLGDKTDEDKERIINIEITDKNYVHIKLNANSELNAFPILEDSRELFKELSKFEDAEQMNVFWNGTAIDDKGNESEIEIVKVGFVKETMDTINFEDFPIESFAKYSLPFFIHPSWKY